LYFAGHNACEVALLELLHWAGTETGAQAKRSAQALKKVHHKRFDDGTQTHSFHTLFMDLATIVRNTCRRRVGEPHEPSFTMMTTPSAKQKQALKSIDTIVV
jgi:hypothetical protein